MFKKQLFKSNYPKRLMTFKNNYSKIVHEAATIQAIFKFACGYRALYTRTKRLEKKKCAAGAKKLNTRAKTSVSGT